ncbi:hypothetical protein [Mycoplasmoides alvi]|uniref:hypothetical protein n=1 Tax=Mycoplasmoides alvi TaxID=78580 RepID=UPI00051AE548|nr:hypothetical protein [Mycoplasmoides alvi]
MKNNFDFLINKKSIKTKPIITTILILVFVFVYYIIIWILFGEFNLLKLNLIVYPGMVNPDNSKEVASFAQIDSRIYYFLFIPGIFYFLVIVSLRLFKQMAWDTIPLFLSFWLSWVAFILSAALPSPYSILMIAVRIIIVGATFFILFICSNFLLNHYFLNSNKNFDQFIGFADEELKNKNFNKNFKTLLRNNQIKNSIIDIDPQNIFMKKSK